MTDFLIGLRANPAPRAARSALARATLLRITGRPGRRIYCSPEPEIEEPMDESRTKGIKLALSGKGGVGKSTIAAAFCHLAAREGLRVLAVDADPAASLAACLGMGEEERRGIVPISERRALIEERTGAKVKAYGQMFRLNPDVADIAEKESACFRGIHLLVLGAIERGGSGCACPESVILRSLVDEAVLGRDDCAILDMEAGLEHLGRGTARGVDLLAVVVEPGSRAVDTALQIRRMAGEIGIGRIGCIGNKLAGPEDEEYLRRSLPGVRWLGWIPQDDAVRAADREGRSAIDVAPAALAGALAGCWEAVKGAVRPSGPSR